MYGKNNTNVYFIRINLLKTVVYLVRKPDEDGSDILTQIHCHKLCRIR